MQTPLGGHYDSEWGYLETDCYSEKEVNHCEKRVGYCGKEVGHLGKEVGH